MSSRRLMWQLYPSFLLIVLLCVVGATWYAARSVHRFYTANLERSLREKALMLEKQAADLMDSPHIL